MAKRARVWTGTQFVELASAQTDLTAYSTTAQMNTAITAGVGLVPILTQTIGTAVSSVTVNNAFSATYENYKITVTGGVGSAADLAIKLGATATGYYAVRLLVQNQTSASLFQGQGNTSSWAHVGSGNSNGLLLNADLLMPFLSKTTVVNAPYVTASANSYNGIFVGHLGNTTSYTDFTITPSAGTLTGGTISVYGYKI